MYEQSRHTATHLAQIAGGLEFFLHEILDPHLEEHTNSFNSSDVHIISL